MEENDNMDYFYQQVLQKDVSRRLQVGQELIDYLNDPHRSPDLEQDKPRLDKTVDELTGWVNSSHFKVRKDLCLSLRKGTAVSLQSLFLLFNLRKRDNAKRFSWILLLLLLESLSCHSLHKAVLSYRRALKPQGEESIYFNHRGWITRFILLIPPEDWDMCSVFPPVGSAESYLGSDSVSELKASIVCTPAGWLYWGGGAARFAGSLLLWPRRFSPQSQPLVFLFSPFNP